MSIAPRGMSIQEAYRLYREDKLVVNRKYQRKLVWTLEEKQKLIDSILNDYPILLVQLAEAHSSHGVFYEIIDGMQRLNAIVAFIENEFSVKERFFDVDQFARARQAAEAGKFNRLKSGNFLNAALCADYLDYQLAVTTFPTVSEA